MSDEYLWDRSGPPDPQIEELERTLSSLSYQGGPFEIPAVNHTEQRKFFRSVNLRLAIAAAIAIVVLGGLLLLIGRRNQSNAPAVASGKEVSPVAPTSSNQPAAREESQIAQAVVPRSLPPTHATYRNRFKTANDGRAEKIRQAVVAKDQLMTALRLASLKLTIAQKKAQDLNQHEQQIRLSRKIG